MAARTLTLKDVSKVSIVLATRNEEKYISKVLDSLLAQDYSKENMEILVVDAMSTDQTRKTVGEYRLDHSFVRLLDNPDVYVPFAFNIGIKNSEGDIIIFMGAHSTYSPDYVSTVVNYLKEGKAECVGSIARTLPGSNTLMAKAIALGLSSPFGVGNSYMRIGAKNAMYVDTAGCPGYKKEIFNKIGLFNENLLHSQDIELNSRLKKTGGRILLVPDIITYYYARSNFKSFWKHNFRNGLWSILPFMYTPIMPISLRHLVPLSFVSALVLLSVMSFFYAPFLWLFLFICGSYLLINLYISLKIAAKNNNLRYLFLMPIIFLNLHTGYGSGSLLGLFKVLTSKQFWKTRFGK